MCVAGVLRGGHEAALEVVGRMACHQGADRRTGWLRIDEELAASDVLIALVSVDFLASEYCEYELRRPQSSRTAHRRAEAALSAAL